MIRIFDKNKSKSESKSQKKNIPVQYIDQKRIVDINKLLNWNIFFFTFIFTFRFIFVKNSYHLLFNHQLFNSATKIIKILLVCLLEK